MTRFALPKLPPMTHRPLLALSLLLLAACSTAPVEPSAQRNQPSTIPVPAAAEVAGRWDVVSFEGYQPASRHGAFANFWAPGVSLRIDCNRSRIPGVVREGRFVTQPGPRMSTEMGCEPEFHERDSRYFSFFHRSPRIERLTNGRLRLVAGDSVLILERPEQRRLNYLPDRDGLEGKWRMESLTRYGPQDGQSGIGLSDIPGRIVIQGNRLSYDRCPQFALTFTYGTDGRLLKMGGAGLPENANCPQLKPPRETFDMPTPDQILPLLHGNPWVEEIGNGHLLIATEELGLIVAKEP
ncbi:MAG: hypothetical protein H0V46_05440 [Sphingomonas sp.]|nr:hypothetical protein [Sphingomonas sp.]